MIQRFIMNIDINDKDLIKEQEKRKANILLEDNGVTRKYDVLVGVGCWFTNLGSPSDREMFQLTGRYQGNEDKYPKYVNYDAINVNKAKDIPSDYYGLMGVPITFLHKLNSEQFEIFGLATRNKENANGLNTGKYLTHNREKSIGDYKECCLPLIKTEDETKDSTEWYLKEDGTKCKILYARLIIKRRG